MSVDCYKRKLRQPNKIPLHQMIELTITAFVYGELKSEHIQHFSHYVVRWKHSVVNVTHSGGRHVNEKRAGHR